MLELLPFSGHLRVEGGLGRRTGNQQISTL
jgi:hypothetical protein